MNGNAHKNSQFARSKNNSTPRARTIIAKRHVHLPAQAQERDRKCLQGRRRLRAVCAGTKHKVEVCRVGECAEVPVTRDERNALVDTALGDQGIAETRPAARGEHGTFINPHQILALLVWHLAGTRNLPGDIAKTFSVTKLIDKLAAKFGRKLHETPIGFKYICELMLE